ncbi:MucBP domain-containing protein [Listeria aquatica]|uniref:MucBP domain-containing protein n=1 Tax=Listeria aquatica TaxID=1494960 RepID=UPI003F7215DE
MNFNRLGLLTLATALIVQFPLQVNAAEVNKTETTVSTNGQVSAETTAAPVTVNHVYNGTVFKSETLTGEIGDSYTTQKLDSGSSWFVHTAPSNASGTFTSEPQTVTYNYTTIATNRIMFLYRDIDTNGNIYVHNPFDPTQQEQGPKAFEFASGLPNDPVDFTFQKHYVAMDEGHEWPDGTVGTGGSYDFVKASPEIPDTLPAVYPGESMPIVTLYYKKTEKQVPAENIIVRYVDTEGNEIAPSETLSGNIGEDYTTEAKTIDGYTLTETPENATGTFSDTAQTISYVYEKESPVAKDITVKFVDSDGNELAPSETLSGNIGEDYTTEAKTIDGYTLTETPENATGTFSDTAQTVSYVYEKNSSENNDGNNSGNEDGNNSGNSNGEKPSTNNENTPQNPTNQIVNPTQNPNSYSASLTTTPQQTGESSQTKVAKEELPTTGDTTNPILLLLGSLLVLGAFGMIFKRKNAKH